MELIRMLREREGDLPFDFEVEAGEKGVNIFPANEFTHEYLARIGTTYLPSPPSEVIAVTLTLASLGFPGWQLVSRQPINESMKPSAPSAPSGVITSTFNLTSVGFPAGVEAPWDQGDLVDVMVRPGTFIVFRCAGGGCNSYKDITL